MIRRIFINYRHDDAPGTAGRICDHLKDTFGPDSLFIDEAIPKGENFEKCLNAQLDAAFVFLAIIGRKWLHVRDKQGHRRLDTDDDWVRVEIATALGRQIKVIPVLIDGAVMPHASDLPDNLRPLANRQHITLRNLEFGQDIAALLDTLREALDSDHLNGGGANGSTASNAPLVIQAKKFQELVHRYLTTGKRLSVGRFVAGLLIFAAVALFIYVVGGPVGRSGLNSSNEEPPKSTQAERPVRQPREAAQNKSTQAERPDGQGREAAQEATETFGESIQPAPVGRSDSNSLDEKPHKPTRAERSAGDLQKAEQHKQWVEEVIKGERQLDILRAPGKVGAGPELLLKGARGRPNIRPPIP